MNKRCRNESGMTKLYTMKTEKKASIFSLLKPYKRLIILLIFLALLSNGINLILPTIIAGGIDAYTNGAFQVEPDFTAVFCRYYTGFLIYFFAKYCPDLCF